MPRRIDVVPCRDHGGTQSAPWQSRDPAPTRSRAARRHVRGRGRGRHGRAVFLEAKVQVAVQIGEHLIACFHAQRTVVIRTTRLATGEPTWECGEHTAKPESALKPIPYYKKQNMLFLIFGGTWPTQQSPQCAVSRNAPPCLRPFSDRTWSALANAML